jgi:secreted trypsin-like serine protease
MMVAMTIRSRCTVALAVLVSMLAAAPAASAADGRIVGGDKVSGGDYAGAYASVVSVQRSSLRFTQRGRRVAAPDQYAHVCGGTLIAPTLVLTAAHCVSSDSPTASGTGYSVLAGKANLAAKAAGTEVAVEAVFVHPEFTGPSASYGYVYYGGQQTPGYDVAVLRLAEPLSSVTPTPVVQASEDAAAWGAGAGRPNGALALGWGQSVAPGYGRGAQRYQLRRVGLAIRSDRRCERSDEGLGFDAPAFDAGSMLCAGTADGPGKGNAAKATCFGDSGGPLFAPAADGSLRVVGVASWTPAFAPCSTWSVFARTASLRDWIASIPAEDGGVHGLVGPSTLDVVPVDSNSVRLTWPAPATGTPARYRIYRSAAATRAFGYYGPGLSGEDSLALAAVTDAVDRVVELDGLAPRRPGARRTHTIRIDAQDAEGNRSAGTAVKINAPIDATRPSPAGVPNIRPTRRGTYVGFTPAKDDDCIGRYIVQVRGEHGWRNLSTWHNQSCDAQSLIPAYGFGFWGYGPGRTAQIRAIRLPLRGLDAGTWRVRIVAIDRAGNRATSRSRVFELDEAMRGGRFGTCAYISGSVLCTSGQRGLVSVTGSPVDVIVG